MNDEIKRISRPTSDQLREELRRVRNRRSFKRALWSTLAVFCIVAVIAAGIGFFCPVLRVHGESMEPALSDGDIVVSIKDKRFLRGELIAFESEGKILIKRIIGLPGDQITVCLDGRVLVNDKILDEPYLMKKDYGECDIEYPFTVPEGSVFVLGDNRSVSVDSRSSAVGCIPQENIIGRIMVRVWPLEKMDVVTEDLFRGEED